MPHAEDSEIIDRLLASGERSATGAKHNEIDRDLLPWEPNKLNPRHLQVINLFATGAFNQNEIAAITGYTASRVSIILAHPDAQMLIARKVADNLAGVASDVNQIISAHTREAMLVNIDLMRNAKSETVRQRSAWDILDRGGHKAKQVVVNERTELNERSAALIRDAAREIKGEVTELPMLQDSNKAFDSSATDYEIVNED